MTSPPPVCFQGSVGGERFSSQSAVDGVRKGECDSDRLVALHEDQKFKRASLRTAKTRKCSDAEGLFSASAHVQ